MVGNNYASNPGSYNAYRVHQCSDEYNKINKINVKCADESTMRRELSNILITNAEIKA